MLYTTHGLMALADLADHCREQIEAAADIADATGEDCLDCPAKGNEACHPGCLAAASWNAAA